MNKDEVLEGLYNYLNNNLPQQAINIILQNDIRVENFFAIHTGVYLDLLLEENHIQNYSFQYTILLENPKRAHIDIIFTDLNCNTTYLELKHFSISQNRGKSRRLSFYTSNTLEGKKVGIIGDCEKLDTLRNRGYIDDRVNLVCCAFITQRPTQHQIQNMINLFHNYPESADWNFVLPVPYELQSANFGIITLQKESR
jgi:hypothetical protein